MAKQIIVTQNDYGIELETQFVDDKKKPLDITDYDVRVKIIYDDKTIDTILAGHKDSVNGIAYIVLEKEHLINAGLHTSVWSVVDEDEHVTAQENVYYFVKDVEGSEDDTPTTDLPIDADGVLNKFNEIDNNLFELTEQVNVVNEEIDSINEQLDSIEIKNNKFITPHKFKLDSDIDDTNSLQKAIDYCIENKVTLKADKDLYLISKTLNIQELININFDNATIKAVSQLSAIFKINVTIRPNGTHELGTEYGTISNITFNCNNMCDKCIYIEEGRKYLLEKLKIYNMNGIGIDIKAGYEILSENIDMVGTHQNSVGIRITTSDCHFNDIILTDVKRGIINGGTNFYSRIHGWMFTKELLATSDNPVNNSIFFTLNGGGTPQLNQCYSDTYFTSIYVTNYTRIFLNGLTVFYSEYVYKNDLLNYTPHLFYYEKTGETDYNIYDFSRQSIMTNCMVRGINQNKHIKMSNLPKGTSLIRCNSDNNVLTYVAGVEDNCISGLNVKSDFSFTEEKCYNIVNRKDNRVSCKLKLYRDGGFEKNTDYTIALFTDRYKPNTEFITMASVSTDGYSSNFAPCYCYVSPDYGIIIKTPNDDITTRKYISVDLVFDMDYWV